MPYVDGYVIPLPKRSVAAYRRMAQKAGKVWKEYGALEVRECVADQLTVDDGFGHKVSPFPRITKLKRGETIVFSWILFRSRAHRDHVNARVLRDPRIAATMTDTAKMPFDVKRMAYGGFKTIVDLLAKDRA